MYIQTKITKLLVDLDGTLYDIINGYEEHVRQNVFTFMVERLGVLDAATARALWQEHFRVYNQSLRALRAGAGFSFDTAEYWDFIRAGASDFLKPDPALRGLLESLPQRKWVFTNCSEKHCRIALELLGLQGCFAGVIGADAMGDAAKPEPSAFATALEVIGEPEPGPHIAMFEDSAKNLATAKALGLTTLLVGGATAAEERSAARGGTADQAQGSGGGQVSGAGAEAGSSGAGVRLVATDNGGAGAAAGSDNPGHALSAATACSGRAGATGTAQTPSISKEACAGNSASRPAYIDAEVAALTDAELRRAMPALWHVNGSSDHLG